MSQLQGTQIDSNGKQIKIILFQSNPGFEIGIGTWIESECF